MTATHRARLTGKWRYEEHSRLATPLVAAGTSLLAVAGIATWVLPTGASHFWHSYLLHLCFFLSLALGALFFVILQHLTRAGWSVVVRRLAEHLAATIPILGLLFLPIFVLLLTGSAELYSWNDAVKVREDAILQGKAAYLNAEFFTIRGLFYLAVWSGLATYFRRQSLLQDSTRDPRATLRLQRWSGPAMILFALTITFAAFDWIMSLDPHWFSAVFGIYYFSGCVVGFLAVLILWAIALRRQGMLSEAITIEHYHDLGKLLFGFVFFWAYIAFSQYLLIWYANIPEETVWYLVRQSKGWQWVSLILLVGHFLIPFFGMLSKHVRRNRGALVVWASFILLMHWLDLYWLVMPQFSPDGPTLGIWDLLCLIGFAAVFSGLSLRLATRSPLVPVGDPRLSESLAFKNG
jgi:hypothetical protein